MEPLTRVYWDSKRNYTNFLKEIPTEDLKPKVTLLPHEVPQLQNFENWPCVLREVRTHIRLVGTLP